MLTHSSPDFRRLLVISFVSSFGEWMSLMALSYIVFIASGLTALGILTSVPVVAGAALSPWVGAWVDRLNARRVVLLTTIALAVVTAALQWYQPLAYVLLLTVRQVLGGLMYTAQGRLVPAVVPSTELERGAGLLNGADRIGAGLGLAVGPVLAAQLGPTVFLVNSATLLLASALFWGLRADVAPAPTGKHGRTVREALPWLRSNAIVLALYCLGSILWGLRDIGTLPVVEQRLGLDIATWSGAFAAIALVGEVLGAAVLAWHNPDVRTHGLQIVGGLVVALALTIMLPALVVWLPLVVAVKVVEGLASNLLGSVATIVLIFQAPEGLRGRVAGVLFSLTMSVLAMSKLVWGYAIDQWGVVLVYVGALVVTVVVVFALSAAGFGESKQLGRSRPSDS